MFNDIILEIQNYCRDCLEALETGKFDCPSKAMLLLTVELMQRQIKIFSRQQQKLLDKLQKIHDILIKFIIDIVLDENIKIRKINLSE
jgi:hypothetical protein